MIRLVAHGDPKGCPRPRLARSGRVYHPRTDKAWRDCVAYAAKPHRPQKPISGPVSVSLGFFLARPKAHMAMPEADRPKYCLKKPDADNLAKTVIDVLTECGFWEDDAQVVRLLASKRWTSEQARCVIKIRSLEP